MRRTRKQIPSRYWAKGTQLPRINGTEVNLNPANTFDSPFLSMVHGNSKAVISYHRHQNLVLNFNADTQDRSTTN